MCTWIFLAVFVSFALGAESTVVSPTTENNLAQPSDQQPLTRIKQTLDNTHLTTKTTFTTKTVEIVSPEMKSGFLPVLNRQSASL